MLLKRGTQLWGISFCPFGKAAIFPFFGVQVTHSDCNISLSLTNPTSVYSCTTPVHAVLHGPSYNSKHWHSKQEKHVLDPFGSTWTNFGHTDSCDATSCHCGLSPLLLLPTGNQYTFPIQKVKLRQTVTECHSRLPVSFGRKTQGAIRMPQKDLKLMLLILSVSFFKGKWVLDEFWRNFGKGLHIYWESSVFSFKMYFKMYFGMWTNYFAF